MKKILLVTMLISISFVYAQLTDPLWQKAMNIAEKNSQYIPGKTIYHSDIKNPKNSTDDTVIQVEIKHQLSQGNKIVSTILKAMKNNEPMNDEEKKEISNLTEKEMKPKKDGLFFTKDPKKLKIKATEFKKQINNYLCKGYEFEFITKNEKGKEQILKGMAWLECEKGAPILLKFSLKKMPMFVKTLDIENYFYFNNDNEQWYSLKLNTNVEASILGKKIFNVTEFRFSDYWLFQEQ